MNIGDLPIPFAAVTLDLKSGNDVIISKGSLIEAVLKSISIAGIFPVWIEDSKVLVDGGPTASVPVEAAYSLGADKVIGVNLTSRLSGDCKVKSALTINFRVEEIAKYRLNQIRAEKADVLIEPRVHSIHWADYRKIDYGIKEGYRATKEKIAKIRKLLKPNPFHRIKKRFKR